MSSDLLLSVFWPFSFCIIIFSVRHSSHLRVPVLYFLHKRNISHFTIGVSPLSLEDHIWLAKAVLFLLDHIWLAKAVLFLLVGFVMSDLCP